MLVPEVWCRMRVAERDPRFLVDNGYLEKVEDFALDGRKVLASRLGYRITARFVDHFMGRIFEMAGSVFTEEMLRPEKQGVDLFAAGVDAIVETQTRVARAYFDDGSVEAACPPLQALLHIMAHGHYQGMGVDDPRVRALFTRQAMLESDWYRERLATKQARDLALWRRHEAALACHRANGDDGAIDLDRRGAVVRAQLERIAAPGYLAELVGTIGADPFHGQIA
jgi:hypothetical protein